MRKLLILATVILLTMLPMTVKAFESVSSGGVGWMFEKDQPAELGYFVGFGIPIVKKTESGYSLVTTTDYLYSGYSDKIQAIRIYALNKKALPWNFYIALGAGSWAFLSDDDSQALGAFIGSVGWTWEFLEVRASGEIVQKIGPDLFFPNIGVTIGF